MTSPSAAAVQEAMKRGADLALLAAKHEANGITPQWNGDELHIITLAAHVTALTRELEASHRSRAISETNGDNQALSLKAKIEDLTSRLAAAENERDALREKYEGVKAGDWFYPDGDTSSEACCDNVDEVLTERYEAQHDGSAIYVIERAVKLPDLHVSVRVFSEEEKAARGSDDDYVASLHLTAEEARTALGAAP